MDALGEDTLICCCSDHGATPLGPILNTAHALKQAGLCSYEPKKLDWDEGPDGPGGVPCRQSERLGLYAEWMLRLREAGAVYPCFCSDERLGALRREQAARGEPPRYDGRCRALSSGEAERRIASGEKPCWRFALGIESIVFEDVVRGRQAFPAGTIGDFVLERSDGMPTYLFASTIDNLTIEISPV